VLLEVCFQSSLAAATQVDIEISQRAILLHLGDFRDVQVRGFEQIELILHVEVEQALDRAVRGDDVAGHSRILRLSLQLGPVFVSASI
jgi:hypothetical protein